MHATIQKPIDEIVAFFQPEERVFVVGCGNCAAKCHSGGELETEDMARRLREHGVNVAGWASTDSGVSLCKLAVTKKLLTETHKEATDQADSFLILACGQGIHTVMDATDGGAVHPGCDTIFGGETVNDNLITEYCSLCGDCIVEYTGGLCPVTLCAKSLLNGPCGGAKDGKCEVDRDRDCGWQLIYDRLNELGILERMDVYQDPKNNSRWSRPRSLDLGEGETTFSSLGGKCTVSHID
jgi:ferredoxin